MTAMAFDNQGSAISPDAPDHRLALIDFGTGTERQFTYGDVRRLTGAVARGLLNRGLRRGDRVAILSLNRAEFLFTFLGVMQAGLVAVPVNYKLPADTVSYIVDDCDARVAFADAARLPLVRENVAKFLSTTTSKRCSTRVRSNRCRCSLRSQRCSSTPRARAGGPKGSCCRTIHISG